MLFRALITFVGSLALVASTSADNIVYLRIHRPIIEQRLKLIPTTEQDRLASLRNLFREAGCKSGDIIEQPVHGQMYPNLICTLPGTEEGTIVVGARSDFDACDLDGPVHWGGLAMLPLLAESLNSVPHRYSLVFVVFTGHERGLRGASWYVSHLSKEQRSKVRAMIDLDNLGKGPAAFASAESNRELSDLLKLAAQSADLNAPADLTARKAGNLDSGLPEVDTDVYLSDAKPFGRAQIPAISIQSTVLEDSDKQTKGSRLARNTVDEQSYEDTYRLLCFYLIFLDHTPVKGTMEPGVVEAKAAPAEPPVAADRAASNTPVAGQISSTVASLAIASPAGLNPSQPAALPITSSRPPPELSSQGSTTFHANAQLVQVDVSVRDSQGRPIRGLQASDFTVSENGVPQQIRVFEAHVPTAAGAPVEPVPALPPNTYTNRTLIPADDSVQVILFDLLNTATKDQAYSRSQFLKFIKELPKGKHVALFVLSTRLEIVQGFTDDAPALAQAAEKIMLQRSALLTTEDERQQERGANEQMGRLANFDTPKVGVPGTTNSQAMNKAEKETGIDMGNMLKNEDARTKMESSRTDLRVQMTLEALSAIAKTVAGYPGRKNLIWLSGSFPIQIAPHYSIRPGEASPEHRFRGADALDSARNYHAAIREMTNLLTTARVAVYPIDVRGLQTSGIALNSGAGEYSTLTTTNTPNAYSHTLDEQSGNRSRERAAMFDMAEQTGGEAFVGTNDVSGAIARSMDDASAYYTLAYSPVVNDKDISFRRIEVKIDQPGAKLAYRRGYYPNAREALGKENGAHKLALALQPGVPPSTMLIFAAKVLPPDETHKAVRIDYRIDVSAVAFADTPDHQKQAMIDCVVIALDKNGLDAGHSSQTLAATLSQTEYESFLRTGLPGHQEILLPPGIYQLHLGIWDRSSDRIGTLDLPLAVRVETAARQ